MALSTILDQYSTLLCVLLLVYASWLDKKIGIVPNRFWLITWLAASLLSIYRSMTSELISGFVDLVVSVGVTLSISLFLFKVKVFGGSDAKALIILSILIPKMAPLFGLSRSSLVASVPTTFNLLVIFALVLVVNATRNLALCFIREGSLLSSDVPPTRKLLCLIAYKRLRPPDRSSEDESHLESVTGTEPVLLVFAKKRRLEKEHMANIMENPRGHPDTELWVPLRIPLIPLLTLSLIISLLFGDLLSAFVT